MSRYADNVVDQYGTPIVGVSIYVYTRADVLATLTADGGGSLSNPVTSDAYGNYYFNAAADYYNLTFHYGGKQIDAINNVMVGTGPVLPTEILDALSLNGMVVVGGAKGTRAGVTANPDANLAVLLNETFRAGTYAYQPWNFSGLLALDPDHSYNVGAWEETPSRDAFPYFFGYEHLGTFRKVLCTAATGANIVYTGDSTVAGTNLSAPFIPTALLLRESLNHGVWDQVFYNRGQGGKSTTDWLSTYLAGDLTIAGGGPGQLLIIRWGINDFDTSVGNLTVAQSLANFKTALTTIRAAAGGGCGSC